MLAQRLDGGGAKNKLYVDDVFSVDLYDATTEDKTITNGIALAGEGGMVWIKQRSGSSYSHGIYDTVRGATNQLSSNSTMVSIVSSSGLKAFSNSGFSIGNDVVVNWLGAYAAWTFRKAPKFFDVVTYTGNTIEGRQIPHSLGSTPGMMIVKCLNGNQDWGVYHRALHDASFYMKFNTTEQYTSYNTIWNSTAPTSSVFTVGNDSLTNLAGLNYVAYLFAHDTSEDGLIQCGSYNGNGSATGPIVTLGWEPQYLMIKNASGRGNWQIIDNLRGCTFTGVNATLQANLANAETSQTLVAPMATGFQIKSTSSEVNTSAATYIYMAIRRPNKPPASGTDVFMPTVYTGTNTDNRFLNTGILTDMVWLRNRNGSGTGYEGFLVGDRLGGSTFLKTGSASGPTDISDGLDAQLASSSEYGNAFSSNAGIYIGNDTGATVSNANINASTTANGHIALAFRRAAGVFDVVRYVGNQVAGRQIPHNLVAIPELIFIKGNGSGNWVVFFGATNECVNLDQGIPKSVASYWNGTSPTKTTFTVSNETLVNGNSANSYVAYLFASKPGISKVGTYTGNGGTQTIDCGLTTGARFVLIKRTDATGDWFVFDSARGIVSGNDPHLCANTTTVEVTTSDSVDPASSGFVVNQLAATGLNVTSANYLFLALA